VIACDPVHTIDAPGATVAAGMVGVQLKLSSAGVSLTLTLCSVTFPLFLAVNVKVITWPTWSYFAGFRLSAFVSPRTAVCVALTVSGAGGALASVLVALPVSRYPYTSLFRSVIACDPVHTIDAPGATVAAGMVGVQL